MKKIVPILVIGILVFSGLGASAVSEYRKDVLESETVQFSEPVVNNKKDFVTVELAEATSSTWETHKPMVPVFRREYTFPFGTRIDNVDVTFSEISEQIISKPIRPAPESYVLSIEASHQIQSTEILVSYSDIDIYPEQQFSYRTGAGLAGEEHAVFLTVYLYPVQYHPKLNKISYAQSATIEVKRRLPANPIQFGDDYDFLILTPEEYTEQLQPLVDHKNDIGISTLMTTLDEIPSQGVDEAESIKLYIKDAIESWGIDYVLLVGSGIDGNEKFPVRYAEIPDPPHENNFPSVLYYADIYNATGGFSNWDYDGDEKYAEYPQDNPNVDLYPDVGLGMLPCNDAKEVTTVVNKIIDYKAHNKMTNKILQIGGDTFTWDGEGINEGEFANEVVLSKLPGYDTRKLWASEGKITKLNIALGFKGNVDFVDFSGHGSPIAWGTHPPKDEDTWVPPKAIISPNKYFLYIDFDLYSINNAKKLPVVVYNACSNNKYTEHEQCLGWKTLSKANGGGIASFAASGLGFGMAGSDETERRMGWMEVHIFEDIYNTKILGQVWKNVLSGYVTNFSSLDWEQIDQKTVLAMCMFGDPTLAIEDGDNPRGIPAIRLLFVKLLEIFSDIFLRVK
jgi:hypothetical protein